MHIVRCHPTTIPPDGGAQIGEDPNTGFCPSFPCSREFGTFVFNRSMTPHPRLTSFQPEQSAPPGQRTKPHLLQEPATLARLGM